jgi:hypothetical protein
MKITTRSFFLFVFALSVSILSWAGQLPESIPAERYIEQAVQKLKTSPIEGLLNIGFEFKEEQLHATGSAWTNESISKVIKLLSEIAHRPAQLNLIQFKPSSQGRVAFFDMVIPDIVPPSAPQSRVSVDFDSPKPTPKFSEKYRTPTSAVILSDCAPDNLTFWGTLGNGKKSFALLMCQGGNTVFQAQRGQYIGSSAEAILDISETEISLLSPTNVGRLLPLTETSRR